jgi:hypothetical protein
MKKIIIVSSILAVIGISSMYLIKNHKNQPEASQNNSQTQSIQTPNNLNNKPVMPINPNNNIMINPNIVSPEGANRLPKIVPPENFAQIKITPPPEAGLMRDCQVIAKGNPEVMRKCFEDKIQSNVMQVNNDVNKYNQNQQSSKENIKTPHSFYK